MLLAKLKIEKGLVKEYSPYTDRLLGIECGMTEAWLVERGDLCAHAASGGCGGSGCRAKAQTTRWWWVAEQDGFDVFECHGDA